jgi:hypothetical protein
MDKAGTTMQLRPRDPITAGATGDDEDDPGLAAALAASLADAGGLQAGPSHGHKRTHSTGGGSGWEEAEAFEAEDPELAAALAASMEACAPPPAPADQHAQQAPEQQEEAEQPKQAPGPAFPGLGAPARGPHCWAGAHRPQSVCSPPPFWGALAHPPSPLCRRRSLFTTGIEPPAGAPGALELGLRLPDGRRATRRFEAGQTVGHLAAFAAQQGADMGRHHLARQFPRQASAGAGRTGEGAPGAASAEGGAGGTAGGLRRSAERTGGRTAHWLGLGLSRPGNTISSDHL